ncbi:CmcJ/NvfI family oxidoreductase [Congregibacter brevis]|uniref:CmcJ/NvfI family oxidoreductase n=1 Tax=Congregibacter brevis TaxID=3081201 RepID=A0ABZ0IGB8_9GAMM|nr:CmcJ/NvfI family oxidoreductase [Congregibacter sp. IMCC45268]
MRETATVNYHVKSSDVQAFHFDVGGVPGNLISPELKPTQVAVRDVRGKSSSISFKSDGICFERHSAQTQAFDDRQSWTNTYDAEIRTLLTDKIGASEVIVFDHTVRIDNANADRKPARNVHNDYSERSAEQRLIDIVGEERAREFRSGHYGFVNVWRPIENSIQNSPLGFINPRSLSTGDWMTIELIYADRVGEILGVAANRDHDWFYLSKMTPDEVAIFNIYDNRGRPSLGHSALDMEFSNSAAPPRKSIETRTLVRYP